MSSDTKMSGFELKIEKKLDVWQEAIGTFRGFETDELAVTVFLDDLRLIFPEDMKGAIKPQLHGKKGRKIAILRTDIPDKPVLVRTIETN